jgi:hypothetical protein
MVTEIAPRHQREVFSPHPDDPYLSVEIVLYYLISRLRKQVRDFDVLLRLRRGAVSTIKLRFLISAIEFSSLEGIELYSCTV